MAHANEIGITGSHLASFPNTVDDRISEGDRNDRPRSRAILPTQPALKDVFRDQFRIGAAINQGQFSGRDAPRLPTLEQQDATIAAFAALGVKVNITELDVDVLQRATRTATAALLPFCHDTRSVRFRVSLFTLSQFWGSLHGRVTFWGVDDRGSWLNKFPVRGRTNYPLLFDREDLPKPAFDAVVRAAREAAGR